MNRFRAKVMQLNEWARFQELFEEFFAAADKDQRLALLIEADALTEESSTVLIPEFNANLLEEFSPGGWHDFPDARLYRWRLLVGNQSASQDLGLALSDTPTLDGDR
jgi:hypothetical protein